MLLARLSAQTRRIRLGTGGILLTHYSPLKVAETFHMLDALAPGRIDLGIGRATGSDDLIAAALRVAAPGEDYAGRLAELIELLETSAEQLDRAPIVVTPAVESVPEMWLLGSSGYSAALAAELGLPFAYAHFIAGDAEHVTQGYRAQYRPSPRFPEPRVLVAVATLCTEDPEELELFRRALGLWRARVRLEAQPRFPSRDEARTHVPNRSEQRHIADSRARSVAGTPDAARAALLELAARHGADELMLITITPEYESRLRSYELVAAAFGLDRELSGAG